MRTKDCRIDPAVNIALWKKGIRNPPRRIRVRLSRQRNDDEKAKEKLYTTVSLLTVDSYKSI